MWSNQIRLIPRSRNAVGGGDGVNVAYPYVASYQYHYMSVMIFHSHGVAAQYFCRGSLLSDQPVDSTNGSDYDLDTRCMYDPKQDTPLNGGYDFFPQY